MEGEMGATTLGAHVKAQALVPRLRGDDGKEKPWVPACAGMTGEGGYADGSL
jgi:hypothetical protein